MTWQKDSEKKKKSVRDIQKSTLLILNMNLQIGNPSLFCLKKRHAKGYQ